MAQIKTNLQYGVTGTVQSANVADDAVTLAKMASGTDGNVITYDASGNPAVVATGSSGQLLKSQGAGSVPVFATVAGFDVTSITGATALGATPADSDEFVLSDAGVLKRVDYSHIKGGTNAPYFYAHKLADQSINAATANRVTGFSQYEVDPDSVWDGARFTAPSAGTYFLHTNIFIAFTGAGSDGYRYQVNWYKDGSDLTADTKFTYASGDGDHVANGTISSSILYTFGANEYMEVYVYTENTGDTSGTIIGSYSTIQGFKIIT